jgi:hypothetical protein
MYDREFINSNVMKYGKPTVVNHILSNLDKRGKYNCWGFTAAMLNWVSELKWIDSRTMEHLLQSNSVPVDSDNVRNGDIAVYREEDDYLEHTAIVIDVNEELLLHKPGSGKIEIQSFDGTVGDVTYGEIVEFRRPI